MAMMKSAERKEWSIFFMGSDGLFRVMKMTGLLYLIGIVRVLVWLLEALSQSNIIIIPINQRFKTTVLKEYAAKKKIKITENLYFF